MLHYVREDGGMVVVPVDTLKDWLRVKIVTVNSEDIPQCVIDYNEMIYDLLAELEAMGKQGCHCDPKMSQARISATVSGRCHCKHRGLRG